ncbi:MAG: hypothetical protein KDK02_05275 [Rhodobacteraceae bacterium]|nr:hypothetical protein [Paracoccaceae bacterium]
MIERLTLAEANIADAARRPGDFAGPVRLPNSRSALDEHENQEQPARRWRRPSGAPAVGR